MHKDNSQQGRKLFDVLVVVGLKQEGQNDKIKIVPYVKYNYPTTLSNDIQNSLIKPINEFCFPDLSKYHPDNYNWRKKVKSETFSFVLTEGTGEKRWGYCRMTMPGGTAKGPDDFPLCFCLVSFVPCFTIFSQVLNKIESHASSESFEACNSFLNSIYTQPLPPPGGFLLAEGHTFTRPNDSDSLLDHVNFEPLLRYLDANLILSIFASLLVERRIIFTADSLSTLSSTVQAAIAVLYPFIWQHIFIPVLPQSLLSFCCAPMPFVVGILRSSIPELEMMQRSGAVDEVIFVDIDKNRITCPAGMDDYQLLPKGITERLYHAIDNTARAVKQKYSNFLVRGVRGVGRGAPKAPAGQRKGEMSKVDTKDFANAFIAFMVDMLADYRGYITPNGEKKFDLDGFIQHKPPELSSLLRLVGECQMFEMFIRDRMNTNVGQLKGSKPLPPPGGKFEKRLSSYGNGSGNGSASPPNARPGGSSASTRTPSRSRPPPGPAQSPGGGSGVAGMGGSGGKAPLTRFTMYEMGEISRDDITKSVATNSVLMSPGSKINPNTSFSVDHSSFKKMATAEDLRSKDKREQLGILLDNENALTLLVGAGGRNTDLPPPPPPPKPAPSAPHAKGGVGESLADAIGGASAAVTARLRKLPKKKKTRAAPTVSAPTQVTKVTPDVPHQDYAQQEVFPPREGGDVGARAGPRATKAKSMSVIQVDASNNDVASTSHSTRQLNGKRLDRSGGGHPIHKNSSGHSELPPLPPGASPPAKGIAAGELRKKETQEILKKWRDTEKGL